MADPKEKAKLNIEITFKMTIPSNMLEALTEAMTEVCKLNEYADVALTDMKLVEADDS